MAERHGRHTGAGRLGHGLAGTREDRRSRGLDGSDRRRRLGDGRAGDAAREEHERRAREAEGQYSIHSSGGPGTTGASGDARARTDLATAVATEPDGSAAPDVSAGPSVPGSPDSAGVGAPGSPDSSGAPGALSVSAGSCRGTKPAWRARAAWASPCARAEEMSDGRGMWRERAEGKGEDVSWLS